MRRVARQLRRGIDRIWSPDVLGNVLLGFAATGAFANAVRGLLFGFTRRRVLLVVAWILLFLLLIVAVSLWDLVERRVWGGEASEGNA